MSVAIPTEEEVQETIKAVMKRLTISPYIGLPKEEYLDEFIASALSWLYSQGYITSPFVGENTPYHLTPAGWDYWQKLQLGSTLY